MMRHKESPLSEALRNVREVEERIARVEAVVAELDLHGDAQGVERGRCLIGKMEGALSLLRRDARRLQHNAVAKA